MEITGDDAEEVVESVGFAGWSEVGLPLLHVLVVEGLELVKDREDMFVVGDDLRYLDEVGWDKGPVEFEGEPFVAGLGWIDGDVAGKFDILRAAIF